MALRYKIQYMKKYKQGNEEKTAYVDVGAIMDGKNGGFVMKLEMIPLNHDGWFYLSEPREKPAGGYQKRAPPPPAPPPAQGSEPDEDIPF